MKTWLETYKANKINVFVDISTYCNAGCPQCHRTENKQGGLRKVDWLPLVRWSVDEFKQAYTEDLVRATHTWEICGTWGDPIMNKDMYEIAKYILSVNPRTMLTIDTNGSIRPLSWWKKLGELSSMCEKVSKYSERGCIRVDFAIEGITQKMQEQYRRFTKLDVILANMKAFTDAGGMAIGFCVVHKHNQDYLQEIKDLCIEHGAHKVHFAENNRFFSGPKWSFLNEHGKLDMLQQAEEGYYQPDEVRDAQSDWKTRTEHHPHWKRELAKKVAQVVETEDIH